MATEPTRLRRRIAGMLGKRLGEANLHALADPRDRRGRRDKLVTLLHTVIIGLIAGCKSLANVEELTTSLSQSIRRWLRIERRVPDTTLRDALCQLSPSALRPPLQRIIRAAVRRKALEHHGLPFGVVALDGKGTALPSCDDFYAQRQTQAQGPLVGVMRTVTSVLISHPARPCIDVIALPASTNEMGHFESALHALVKAYAPLDLFRLVSYDAGACSLTNATAVRELGLHYLFGLKGTQPTLLAEAQRLLGSLRSDQAAANTEDIEHGQRVVRRVFLTDAMASFEDWSHLRTVLCVESESLDQHGHRLTHERRYFVSSLPLARLTAEQWLLVVRRHWGVETAHQLLDVAFAEDDHPWIQSHPRAAVVIAFLRRIAYNLLTLFRSVTQRSEVNRAVPWLRLMHQIYLTLVAATNDQLAGLRPRPPPAPA
jgi:hypothetical protein